MHSSVQRFDRLPQVDSWTSRHQRSGDPGRAQPLIGVIRNPRSHRNKGPAPAWTNLANLIVEMPQKRSDLRETLEMFAQRRIDYLAIDGGDGTVRDVLTCAAGLFGELWPPIIVMANGKTNALAYDLGLPTDWSMPKALAAIENRNFAVRYPMVVSERNDANSRVYGFVLGGGAFTNAVTLGQNVHDWGAFNSLAVGLTAVWSLFQSVFGPATNRWRRGVEMKIRMPGGRPAPHSGTGPEEKRFLFFASSLERLPAGLDPFRSVEEGPIRALAVDTSRRRLLALLPGLGFGRVPDDAGKRGMHLFGGDSFDFEIAERFILDGEAFPAGSYHIGVGPKLRFVVP